MQTNLDTKMNTNMVKFKIDIHICRLLKFRYMAIVDLVDFILGHRVRNPALMSKEYACIGALSGLVISSPGSMWQTMHAQTRLRRLL